MADFKRRTLLLSTGKQIRLFGNSVAISKSLQIGEGYAPNIFSTTESLTDDKQTATLVVSNGEGKISKGSAGPKSIVTVSNPFNFTDLEMMELADYNIRLWLDLKDNIRRFGINNPKVFNREGLL